MKLELKQQLQAKLKEKGITSLTPVQESLLSASGSNILSLSPSGSGKTLAFLMKCISWKGKNLIIQPTRQLALQTLRSAQHFLGVQCVLAVGGRPTQLDKLRVSKKTIGNDLFVIGTLGRVTEWLRKRIIFSDQIQNFVLDEADKILQNNKSSLNNLFRKLKINCKRKIFVTATQSKQLRKYLIDRFNSTFQLIEIRQKIDRSQLQAGCHEKTLANVLVRKIAVKPQQNFNEKLEQLKKILALPFRKALIFYSCLSEGNKLFAGLSEFHPCFFMHSSVGQSARFGILSSLDKTRIIVTSDLLARGFDCKDIDTVIQWDFPADKATFIHRTGRAGRRGQNSLCIYFNTSEQDSPFKIFDWKEGYQWLQLQNEFDKRMLQQQMPNFVNTAAGEVGQWEENKLDNQELIWLKTILTCSHCIQIMKLSSIELGYCFSLLEDTAQ